MAIYAISDLHLSFGVNKPMNIFGKVWDNYEETIRKNWKDTVSEEDTVIIPGDISWAMTLNESIKDFEYIDSMPGKKILLRGNHDYYFSTKTKMQNFFQEQGFKDFEVLHNNAIEVEDYIICGTRGWICKGSERFSGKDEKIYLREEIRLRLSLEEAKRAGYEKIICMLHYPPTNEKLENSVFTSILEEFKVEKVVYGHLHGNILKDRMLEGNHNGVEYILTSCDYIDFNPIKILD